MTLPDVSIGQPHVEAHNAERHSLNALLNALPLAALKTDLTSAAAIERQYARQHTDRRTLLPLASEPVYSTSPSVLDPTFTRSYAFAVSGMTVGATRTLTQAELDASPIDMGLPVSRIPHIVYFLGGTTPYHYTNQTIAQNIMPRHYRFTFNGPKFTWLAYYLTGFAQGAHQVYVDGQPMTLRPPAATTIVAFETITFPDARPRKIDIYTSALVGAFYCSPLYDFFRPEKNNLPVFATIGDSYSVVNWSDAGTAYGVQEEAFPAAIETHLGLEQGLVNGIGGTGFIVRTLSRSNNYLDRLPDIQAINPDILWIPNSSVNDLNQRATNAGAPTDAAILAQVRSFLLPLRAQNPGMKIVYGYGHTPPVIFRALAGQMRTLGDYIRANCTDIGIYYVDSTTWLDGTGWSGSTTTSSGNALTSGSAVVNGPATPDMVGASITGTGVPAGAYVLSYQSSTQFTMSANATATNGSITLTFGSQRKDGNCDWAIGNDGIHLTSLGARFLRGRWAEKLRKILVDDGTLLNTVV